jgi:hypothetical protein
MLVSVLAFLAASTAQATETAPPAPAPAVKEKKICRTDQLIGSTVPRRVCKTRSEWSAQNGGKAGQPAADGAQRPTPSSGSGTEN